MVSCPHRSCFSYLLGRSPPVLLIMDAVLRVLEGLRRDELVWLNTYLTGRLRALPRPTTAAAPVQMQSAPTRANTACDPGGELPAGALAERVGDFNMSMDPWERTGAAPQGWATHLHQTALPVQGYIQLRPHDTTLPSFGGCPAATAGTENGPADTEAATLGRVGKASPSVSILSRAPLCPNTCIGTADVSLAISLQIMMITYATVVNKGNCFLNEFLSGKPRACPSVTLGVRSAPLNDAARGVLTNTTYACSANDEEWFSSPLRGARILGLPTKTDWY